MQHFLMLYLPPVLIMIGIAVFAHSRLMERPEYRGWWGEYKVNLMLRICLSNEYTLLTNVLLKGMGRGNSTQVDHIVVSRFGIFVIETKAFKGKIIYDMEDQAHWLQIVGKRKYKIQNPTLQNYAHVKAVQKSVGVHSQKIYSYTVMAGSAVFPYGYPDGVFSMWGVVRKIQQQRTPIMTRAHTAAIRDNLQRNRIIGGRWAARHHVKKLKAKEKAD